MSESPDKNIKVAAINKDFSSRNNGKSPTLGGNLDSSMEVLASNSRENEPLKQKDGAFSSLSKEIKEVQDEKIDIINQRLRIGFARQELRLKGVDENEINSLLPIPELISLKSAKVEAQNDQSKKSSFYHVVCKDTLKSIFLARAKELFLNVKPVNVKYNINKKNDASPITMSKVSGTKGHRSQPLWRRRLDLGLLVYLLVPPLIFDGGLLTSTGISEGFITKVFQVLGFLGGLFLVRALLVFERWNDEIKHSKKFFIAFAALLVWLVMENCFIWAISASDLRKYELVTPLQDNLVQAYDGLRSLLPAVGKAFLNDVFEKEWIGIKQKLVALIALCFSAAFDELPYSGFGMAARMVWCILWGRAIRTVAFMLTVVPNPRPDCYAKRFPPVPDTWTEFFRIGFSKIRAGGGCNDLIVSGHGVIYSAVVVTFSEYYPGVTSKLLWLALIRSNIRGPLTNQHYSVDMFLATIITWLVWKVCEDIYPAKQSILIPRPAGSPPDGRGLLVYILIAALVFVLVMLAVIIIVGGA